MKPGTVLDNRFEIIKSIGEGGMANVYLAMDTQANRKVAIKFMRLDLRDNPDFSRRFAREAEAASKLIHPNITKVYGTGSYDGGSQYLVMEYVDGTDLKTYIKNNFPIPYQKVVNITSQLLSGLDAAHSAGIVHRDIKPQNILIDKQGNVKIVDFGISLARSEFGMTQTNTVLGSVHYLSPEQTRGGITTNKSDIYATGIILYELLTGKVPFEGETAVSVALKHSQTNIPSVRDFDRNIPQALENVIIQATAKNPNNRYTTAEDMREDLQSTLSPRRANEEKILPFDDELVETRIIPVDEIRNQTQKNTKASRTSSSNNRWRLLPWLIGGLITVALGVIAAAIYAPGQVSIPETSGLTETAARKLLEDNDLKIGKITRNSSENIKENFVTKTTPPAGSRVDKKRTVDLVISTGKKKVKMDDFVGSSFTSASNNLKKAGFKVTRVTEVSADIPEGQVISQSIEEGEMVIPSETTVELVVSSGQQKITVPDFSGLTVADALAWGDANGVIIFGPNNPLAIITSQTPAAGSSVEVGSTISVITENEESSENSSSATSSSSSGTGVITVN